MEIKHFNFRVKSANGLISYGGKKDSANEAWDTKAEIASSWDQSQESTNQTGLPVKV